MCSGASNGARPAPRRLGNGPPPPHPRGGGRAGAASTSAASCRLRGPWSRCHSPARPRPGARSTDTFGWRARLARLLRPGALRAVPRPVPRSVPRTHAPGSLRRVPASSAHFCSEEKAPPTFELFPSRVFTVRYVSITWIPLLLHARWGACGAGWGRRGVSRLLLGHKSTA